MDINKVLTKAQNKLIKEAKTKGIYENFGQKEVSKLEDKFINSSDYSAEMNTNRRLIQMFDEWCMNYTGNYQQLKFITMERIYGVIDANDCLIDISRSETVTKQYATKNGYNKIGYRIGYNATITHEKLKNKWLKISYSE